MVTIPLLLSCGLLVAADADGRAIAWLIARHFTATQASTIEGGRDARTDFDTQMCESKIKGPARLRVKELSAHGFLQHEPERPRAASDWKC